MDETRFDHFFSDKLQDTQDFVFREDDWEELSGRLAMQQDQRQKRGWIVWFLLGALLLLLGISLWQSHIVQLKQLEIQNAQQQIQNLEIQLQNAILAPCDTIYQTVIQEKPILISSKDNRQSNANPQQSKTAIPAIAALEKRLTAKSLESTNRSTNTIKTERIFTPNKSLVGLGLAPIKSLSVLPYPLSFPEIAIWPSDEKSNAKKRNATVSRWQLGPGLGLNRLACTDCSQSFHANIGLEARYRLNSRVQLEARYQFHRYESNFGSLGAKNIAIQDDLGSQYYIQIAELNSQASFFQFSLGLQYQLPQQFFLGFDVSLYHHLQRSNQYHINPSYGGQPDFTKSYNRPSARLDRYEVNVGRNFKFGSKVQIPLSLYYQRNGRWQRSALPALLGLRIGILYQI